MKRALIALVAGCAALEVSAQSVRVSGASWWQGIDLRPFRRDSVLRTATTEAAGVHRMSDGTLVACAEGAAWCTYLASGAREMTQPFLHDVSVAGWGLGEGISFHAHGRARSAVGGNEASWPRLRDRFDLLDAYLEVDRTRGRLRLGRQWTLGGLGAYSYDGLSVLSRWGDLDAEVMGGQALVQGLSEPYTSAEIGQVDDLPPEARAWLYGGRARWRRGSAALTATYVRLLEDGRAGVYAERAGIDVGVAALGLRWSGNVAWDVAARQLNEARIRATRSLGGGLEVGGDVRRHRPFFELWTIWGAFAPVGFDEGRLTAGWTTSDGTLAVTASGARREYQDPGTGLASVPLRTDGWRAAFEGSWQPAGGWSATGSYGVDIGVGSSQSDVAASLSREFGDRGSVGGSFSAWQTIYEYRVGTGRVIGGSLFATARLTPDVRLRVDAGQYGHTLSNDAPGRDWSQRRASVRLEWAVGSDPGRAR